MNKTITAIVVVILLVIGGYFLFSDSDTTDAPEENGQEMATGTPATSTDDSATSSEDMDDEDDDVVTTIGTSVEGRDIEAYHFGDGETEILFIGGIHGGYEYNTSLLSYDLIDYFEDNSDVIPEDVTVMVIPVMNPDGLYEIAGTTTDSFTAADMPALAETIPGRFNANGIDLNRNFDCDWQSQSSWQSRTVDGGDEAFSEPESQAIRDYVTANNPAAAVVYYSAAGAVYSSSCEGDVMAETTELMNTYADASGYPAEGEFTAYPINGDMVNWMAKQGIPAISVLLSNHEDAETDMNQAGVEAVLEAYAE